MPASPSLISVLRRPAQYDPPVWRTLRERGHLTPTTWYLSGVVPRDPEIARDVHWGDYDRASSEVIPLRQVYHRLLRAPRPSAVLCAGWRWPSSWAVLTIAHLRGIPVIMPIDRIDRDTASSPWRARTKAAIRSFVYRRFDGFLTTGTLGRALLEELGIGSDCIAERLYPIDARAFLSRAEALRETVGKELGVFGGQPDRTILTVAKFSEREDPFTALRAFAKLLRDNSAARLVCVGDGPLRPEVEALIAQLGLTDKVHLAGYVPYSQLPGYYANARVFVHVPYFEPWGISVTEALSVGVSVVTTNIVGATHDMEDTGVGRQVQCGDSDGLADALAEALSVDASDSAQRSRAEAARFDVSEAARQLEVLVEHLERSRGRRRYSFSRIGRRGKR